MKKFVFFLFKKTNLLKLSYFYVRWGQPYLKKKNLKVKWTVSEVKLIIYMYMCTCVYMYIYTHTHIYKIM